MLLRLHIFASFFQLRACLLALRALLQLWLLFLISSTPKLRGGCRGAKSTLREQRFCGFPACSRMFHKGGTMITLSAKTRARAQDSIGLRGSGIHAATRGARLPSRSGDDANKGSPNDARRLAHACPSWHARVHGQVLNHRCSANPNGRRILMRHQVVARRMTTHLVLTPLPAFLALLGLYAACALAVCVSSSTCCIRRKNFRAYFLYTPPK